MKIFISLLLLISFAQAATKPAVKTVVCELQSFKYCKDCEKRIPASCEDHAFNGSLDIKTKPVKLHWLVSNPKNGTEKIIIENNTKKTLGDLKNSKDKRQLIAVEVPASTALYKDQSSTQIAGTMTPANKQVRAIASEKSSDSLLGGIGRAQKACGKKGCL
jgi:hypothetical protein